MGYCAGQAARSAGTTRKATRCSSAGTVVRSFIEGGRHLVEIAQEAHNQDGELSVVGTGVVELLAR